MAFMVYDLLLYFWHRASHHFELLWQFHKIHHSDAIMNVTTAFRLHLVDVLMITLVKATYLMIFGFDKSVILTNELINTVFLMFHHSNIAFKGEKYLSLLFIVPSLHRVHHSTERYQHDNNYGAVFSIWDRLFGTLIALKPKSIGINEHVPDDLLGLFNLGLGITPPKPKQPLSLDVLEVMIAEAAYYKAEKRNFSPGDELRDWLEAKADIIRKGYQLQSADRQWGANKYHYLPRKISVRHFCRSS